MRIENSKTLICKKPYSSFIVGNEYQMVGMTDYIIYPNDNSSKLGVRFYLVTVKISDIPGNNPTDFFIPKTMSCMQFWYRYEEPFFGNIKEHIEWLERKDIMNLKEFFSDPRLIKLRKLNDLYPI